MRPQEAAKFDLSPETYDADRAEGLLKENGPWEVNIWSPAAEGRSVRVVLQSDTFCHDVALIIDGDFANVDQKVRYATLLAARMNRMPKE